MGQKRRSWRCSSVWPSRAPGGGTMACHSFLWDQKRVSISVSPSAKTFGWRRFVLGLKGAWVWLWCCIIVVFITETDVFSVRRLILLSSDTTAVYSPIQPVSQRMALFIHLWLQREVTPCCHWCYSSCKHSSSYQSFFILSFKVNNNTFSLSLLTLVFHLSPFHTLFLFF